MAGQNSSATADRPCTKGMVAILPKTLSTSVRIKETTTVMEKAIAHPTDAKLYEKARLRLVALAREGGLHLRQSYARKSPRLAQQVGRRREWTA